MLAKSCEGNTSNPRNQLDSKKVLPLAGKFTPTAAAAQSQPPQPFPFTTAAVGHFNLLALVLVLVADVVGFALKYTVRHEICTCRYN